MSDEVKLINKELKELNKKFQDLSTLKKKLLADEKLTTVKDKYKEYNFIVKKTVNEPIDFDKLIDENNLNIGVSIYGLVCISYEVGGHSRSYHIAKTEDEANNIRLIEGLMNVSEHVKSLIKENKEVTPDVILGLFDGARSGQQLEESTDTEEIS